MTAAIHQPDYIPYLGYFYKIARSDVFVFLDDAQFSTSGGHDRNTIKSPGGPLRLKVPVRQTLGDAINGVETKDELGWKERHLEAVERCYRRAGHFGGVFPVFRELIERKYASIAEMNEEIVRRFCWESGISRRFLRSSELGVESRGERRIIEICRAVGADTYLSGTGAKAYQSEKSFSESGIRLVYSGYRPFEYPQLWGDFVENLSAVDFLLNCGFCLEGALAR